MSLHACAFYFHWMHIHIHRVVIAGKFIFAIWSKFKKNSYRAHNTCNTCDACSVFSECRILCMFCYIYRIEYTKILWILILVDTSIKLKHDE